MTTIKLKRGTATQWSSSNEVLAAGEVGFERDTGKLKIGDGTSAWTSLPYYINQAQVTTLVNTLIGGFVTDQELSDALANKADATALAAKVDSTTFTNSLATKAGLTNGKIQSAQLFSGLTLTALWDPTNSVFKDASGASLNPSARPYGRADIFWNLIGGPASVAPSWVVNGDMHQVTE